MLTSYFLRCTLKVGGRERQTRVMAIVLGAGGFAQLAGPALAGYLYQSIPGYPALASSFVGACIPLLALGLACRWLPETLEPEVPATGTALESIAIGETPEVITKPSATGNFNPVVVSGRSPVAGRSGYARTNMDDMDTVVLEERASTPAPVAVLSKLRPKKSILYLLTRDPVLRHVTLLRACIGFQSFALVELVPLWAIAPRRLGGLGFDQVSVGKLCALSSLLTLVFMFIVLVPLIERLGLVRAMTTGALIAMIALTSLPLVSIFSGAEPSGSGFGELAAATCCFSLGSIGIQCCTNTIFAATNNAAAAQDRGLVNGIAVTIEGIGKGSAPALVASMFAISLISHGEETWGHGLVFWALAAFAGFIAVASSALPISLQSALVVVDDDESVKPIAQGKAGVETESGVRDEPEASSGASDKALARRPLVAHDFSRGRFIELRDVTSANRPAAAL